MDMSSESCTPAQHTVMLEGSSSVGVMPLGGAAHGEEGQGGGAMNITEPSYYNTRMCPMCVHSSQGTITSTDVGSLVPTAFTANALRVNLSPLVKFTRSWLSNNETCICSKLGNV